MIEPRTGGPLAIAALVTDSFGGYGGIAKFNADLLTALGLSPRTGRIRVLPRLMPETEPGTVPEFVILDRAAAAGKLAFGRRSVAYALERPATDVVLCGHINLLPFAWPMARRTGARLALVIHGVEAWTPHASPLVRALSRRIDALISVSRYSRERFEAWSPDPGRSLFLLPNCVDLDRFVPGPRDPSLAERYGLGEAPVLLTVARLAAGERYKGVDEVLEALPVLLRRRPALKYLVVGDGDDRARLTDKAAALGVAHATVFAGRIPEDEKVAHFGLASAYVMPSTGEGFGIVFIEAAACGVPVIGSTRDGSREALLEGKLGRLIDPGKPAALIEAIEGTLDGAGPRERHPDIDTFGWDAFRTRVESWCGEQRRLRAVAEETGPPSV